MPGLELGGVKRNDARDLRTWDGSFQGNEIRLEATGDGLTLTLGRRLHDDALLKRRSLRLHR